MNNSFSADIKNEKIEAGVPSVGYFPKSFPRDPLEINTFNEHLILGQILDTLITTDRSGRVTPGVAKSWKHSLDGLSIDFEIQEGLKFSDGSSLDAKDVHYSLLRHINYKTSQSNGYLESIKEIKVTGEFKLRIILSSPRIALIKVLSREQLGIVPDGWKFNKNAKSPYVGTGHYALIKENNEWFLVANKMNHSLHKDGVPKWKVLIGEITKSIDNNEIATYMPYITNQVVKKLQNISVPSDSIKSQQSFVQTSAWKHPKGVKDEARSAVAFSIMAESIELMIAKYNKLPATGVIPIGIMGHLKDKVSVAILSHEDLAKLKPKLSEVRFSILDFLYDDFFDLVILEKLEKKYNLKINIKKVKVSEINLTNTEFKPDYFVARWAGGFNDPEGFIAILNKILSVDFKEYIGELKPVYLDAISEHSSLKRGELFNKIGKQLINMKLMLPAWRTEVSYYIAPGFYLHRVNYRYSPRLHDVRVKSL